MNKLILTDDQIRAIAPSVFAEKPWEGVSERYAFIPTVNVLNGLRDAGFMPVDAKQSLTRIAGKKPFTKHMLRFQHRDDLKGAKTVGIPDLARAHAGSHHYYKKGTMPELVELVLTNSHDRSSAYCLDAGIFKLVCSNGLIIRSNDFGSIHIFHSGNIVDQVLSATQGIIARAPLVRDQLARWKAVTLDDASRLMLANAALIQRYGLDDADNMLAPVDALTVLVPRRPEDAGNDLWTVTNIIQENLMRGSLEGRSSNGRRIRTRSVTSINTELDLNRGLWALAEVMAERLAK
jgi:hypothetical protein